MRTTTSTAKPLPSLKLASDPPIHGEEARVHSCSTVVGFSGKASASLCKLLGRLRYRHLSLLVALDEHRNLHRAAKVVHLAQPTASKLVRDLESLFGSSLFDRLPTGMQPTQLGDVVLAFARHALGHVTRLAADLDHRRAGRDGHLVVATTTDLLSDVIATAMVEMKERRPLLAVQLLNDSSAEVIDHLIAGQVDIVAGYFRGDPYHIEAEYEVIGNEALCIVASQHNPLCHEPSSSVYALERAAWILHPPATSSSSFLQRIFLRAGMKAPANVVECNSLSMTLDLVLRSNAVTILPEGAIRRHLQSRELARLSVAVGGYPIEFGILTRRDEALGPAATEFRGLLRRFRDCSDFEAGVALVDS